LIKPGPQRARCDLDALARSRAASRSHPRRFRQRTGAAVSTEAVFSAPGTYVRSRLRGRRRAARIRATSR
jgi:hypothetical protein